MKKGLKQMTVEAMQAEQNKIVKSAKPKPVKVKQPKPKKLFPVAPLDMKIGMTISGHGTVTDAKLFTGRARVKVGKRFRWKDGAGLKGVLLFTTEHPGGVFYQEDATVWCVK